MHESIAKAQLKGQVRLAQSQSKEILDHMQNQHLPNPLLSNKKGINKYIKAFTDMAANSIIKEKYHIKRSSWHYKYQLINFQDTPSNIPGYGSYNSIIMYSFDTRKLINIKKMEQGHVRTIVKIFCHEHFFIRCIQRINALNIGDIGKKIYPIIEWLIQNNIPMKHIPEDAYFVCEDCVLVALRLPNSQGLLFKTILMKDQMTDKQNRLFTENKNLSAGSEVFAYLANEEGCTLRTIPKANNDAFAIDSKPSNWLFHLEYGSTVENEQNTK